jgi:hypothetical protein
MKYIFFLLVFLTGPSCLGGIEELPVRHGKPLLMRIMSDDDGNIVEEKFQCTSNTCCFEELFYCDMEEGKCICDIYRCGETPNKKEYWIELTGVEAETICGRAHLMYRYTGLCLCDRNKQPPCGQCSFPLDEEL